MANDTVLVHTRDKNGKRISAYVNRAAFADALKEDSALRSDRGLTTSQAIPELGVASEITTTLEILRCERE